MVVTWDLQSIPVGATTHQPAGPIKARTDSKSANLRTGHHGTKYACGELRVCYQIPRTWYTRNPVTDSKRSRLIRLDSRLGPADCWLFLGNARSQLPPRRRGTRCQILTALLSLLCSPAALTEICYSLVCLGQPMSYTQSQSVVLVVLASRNSRLTSQVFFKQVRKSLLFHHLQRSGCACFQQAKSTP